MDGMSLDNRHKFALPYWARPSLSLAHGANKGGSSRKAKDDDEEDDDLDDDDGDEEDDEDDEDEEDDDLADLTEEELKAELRKTQAQLARSSSSNAAKRKRLKAREAELAEARRGKPAAKPKGKSDDDAPDIDAITSAAKAEAKTEAKALVIKAEARGALRAAGVPADRVAKAVGLLSLDDVDVDDDGEVEGVDDAIDALRSEWPELFPKGAARKRARVAGDKDTDGKATRSRKPMTTTEMQVAAALGKPIRR